MSTKIAVNLAVVVVYLAGMLGLGLWLSRFVKSGSDYFIAGRSLNRWVICSIRSSAR